METAIRMSGVSKSFGPQKVLTGIHLEVPTGTIYALLGPNGAGKTTIINILSTLVKPDAGIATVAGHSVVDAPERVKEAISVTGQAAAVDEVLTGAENLRMMARLAGFSRAESRERADELLRQFDLVDAAGKRVKTYSGGMRRRLDLAISLIATPPIIFLDEPTTGLDTRSRQALWALIRELRDAGTTIFLTTQYLEEADQLADSIAVINGGRVVATGTAAALKAQVGTEVVEVRGAADELLREIATDGTVGGLAAALSALDAADAGLVVRLREPSLDDVFLALTAPASASSTAGASAPASPTRISEPALEAHS